MRLPRFFLTIFFFVLILVPLTSDAKKVIVFVLDDSGSMNGGKYLTASYSMQILAALLDKDAELHIIKNAIDHKIDLTDRQASLNDIRSWVPLLQGGEIENVDPGISILENADPGDEKWMILMGDGVWEKNQKILKHFTDVYKSQSIKVIFLNIWDKRDNMNADSFAAFLDGFPAAKRVMMGIESDEIRRKVEEVSTEVLAVDNAGLKKKKEGNCIILNPEISGKRIIILNQDRIPVTDFPKVTGATLGGENLTVQSNYTASNIPKNLEEKITGFIKSFITKAGNGQDDAYISGAVTTIVPGTGQLIPAGKDIKICFDHDVDLNKIKVLLETSISSQINISSPTGGLKKVNENIYTACLDDKTVQVATTLIDDGGKIYPEKALRDAEITLHYSGSSKKMDFANGRYVADIGLLSDTIEAYITTYKPGYFNYHSNTIRIIRKKCEETERPKSQVNIDLGSISIGELISGHCFEFYLRDAIDTTKILNPNDYDFKTEGALPFYIKEIKINVVGNSVQLCPVLKDIWCECFIPKILEGKLIATPKSALTNYLPISANWRIKVETEKSWWAKCWILIAAFLISLFLLWYFTMLNKKRRFKKGSKVHYQLKNRFHNNSPFDEKLRKKGLLPWFNRWLIPFPHERRSLNLLGETLKTEAAHAGGLILVPIKSIDKKKTLLDKLPIEEEDGNLKFSNNSKIQIKQSEGKMLEIEYDPNPGVLNDVNTIRTIYKIFIAVILSCQCFMLYLLIKSLM